MAFDLTALHAAIAAVAPINGVSVGLIADKATWRVDFDISATQTQKDAAATIIANYTVDGSGNTTAQNAEIARQTDIRSASDRSVLLNQLRIANAAQINTWVDNNVTSLADARTVLKAILKVIALDARS